MRKFIISVSILLVIPATIYAGFSFGLIQATKKTGEKVDEKVAQKKATLLINSQTPSSLTAVAVSSTQINISWTVSSSVGVVSYKVYRNGNATTIATPTRTTYSDTGLTSLTVYSYQVSACNSAGNCSPLSASVSATTPDTQPPTVPTNFTAVAVSSSQINLSWTTSADDVGVINYKIYRDGGVTSIATPAGTTYNNIGLTVWTVYSYTVSACDAAWNCSALSTSVSTRTLDTQAPTVPTNLLAVAVSSCQINLSWTAATDDAGVTNYKVYRDGGAIPIAVPTGTTYSNISLLSSNTYSYAVSACDAAGNCSAQSITTSTTTPDTEAPTVPTNLTAVAVSSFQVNLNWAASTDDVGVINYKIYRDGGVTSIATPAGTTYSNIGLTVWTVYSYTVNACDAAGNCSALSTSVSTRTLDTQAPTVPTNLLAVAVSSCQINLSWTAATDDAGVTNYKVYRDGGAIPIAVPTGTTYNDTSLTLSTSYSYTVRACDATGNCSANSPVAFDITLPPTAGGEWLLVPGNLLIGTSDFYVMKYEAKYIGGVATSTATVTPWVNITQPGAITACSALGAGYHLLTIPEIQTINRNIEAQSANWVNGTIGSLVSSGGGLKRGNVGITDSASYMSAGMDYGSNPSAERTLKASLVFSNGGVIWDWSGNVFEWIYGAGVGGTLGTPGGVTLYTGIGYREWNSSSPDLSQERPILGPSNSGWTSLNGVGTYYGGATTGVAYRGGARLLYEGAGVFAFEASHSTSDSNSGIGFRCGR